MYLFPTLYLLWRMKILHLTKQVDAAKAMELLDAEIVKCKSSLKVVDDIIQDAKGNLQKALSKKNVDRELTQQALSKIEIGTERKKI